MAKSNGLDHLSTIPRRYTSKGTNRGTSEERLVRLEHEQRESIAVLRDIARELARLRQCIENRAEKKREAAELARSQDLEPVG